MSMVQLINVFFLIIGLALGLLIRLRVKMQVFDLTYSEMKSFIAWLAGLKNVSAESRIEMFDSENVRGKAQALLEKVLEKEQQERRF